MAELNVENRTLFVGDNLEMLRGLNSECVDLVYLDPPFNSKKNYAAPIGSKAAGASFNDFWTLDTINQETLARLLADGEPEGYVIAAAGQAAGESTQAYLTMMYERLREMRRVLKGTGSIWLHCDPTESAWLKALMDAIFGRKQFRNEITWRRTSGGKGSQTFTNFGRATDILLYYTKSQQFTFNPVFVPLSDEELSRKFNRKDAEGREFRTDHIEANDALHDGNALYTYKGYLPKNGWLVKEATLRQMDAEGRIYWSKNGRPYRKYFRHEYQGQKPVNVWDDINIAPKSERTGFPTQKPLALLNRIIEASSSRGDVVLDPFCGCATTCVAAEVLGRKWIGIDISDKAADLVKMRLRKEVALGEQPISIGEVNVKKQPARRTDAPRQTRSPNIRDIRFREQDGACNGCKREFPVDIFEIDHIIPRSKGGPDIDDNLQLLCPPCNKKKGKRSMSSLLRQLRQEAADRFGTNGTVAPKEERR